MRPNNVTRIVHEFPNDVYAYKLHRSFLLTCYEYVNFVLCSFGNICVPDMNCVLEDEIIGNVYSMLEDVPGFYKVMNLNFV